MGFKVNMTGVELRDFDPVPAGRYAMMLSDLVYSEASKRSKQPKVDLTFDLLKGLDGEATTEPPYNNRKAFYTISLQETSKWNVLRSLVALGDNADELQAAGDIEIEKEDYIGRFTVGVLGQEEYEGVMRQRTRRLEPLADWNEKHSDKQVTIEQLQAIVAAKKAAPAPAPAEEPATTGKRSRK